MFAEKFVEVFTWERLKPVVTTEHLRRYRITDRLKDRVNAAHEAFQGFCPTGAKFLMAPSPAGA
jgi:hypothetical protein